MADPVASASLLEGLRRDAMHSRDVAQALAALRDAFAREGIPFAVIGALAMRQHGYVRHTEDIDIVTTPEGLVRIHERLVGRGYLPRSPGLRKKLRDTKHKVDIDVLQSGENAGALGSPVTYPDPRAPEYAEESEGIRYATLRALIGFKIASGIWGRRMRDLADAQKLIQVNGLASEFADGLPEAIRAKYLELLQGASDERDIE